jgi:hypothetical protein
MINKTYNPTCKNIPIGVISSRGMNIYVKSYKSATYSKIPVYYWDFLCIHREHVLKKIGRNLIQTHEYNQRIQNPTIQVSLFKKEMDLCKGIVPLTQYSTFMFHLPSMKIPKLPLYHSLIKIEKENISILSDFFEEMIKNTSTFDFISISDLGNLISLIDKNILFVFCLTMQEQIFGFYFFKNMHTQYEDFQGGDTLQLIGSINNDSAPLFYTGFLQSLFYITKKKNYKILFIENISHNHAILSNWIKINPIIMENKTAYYLYNFICPGSPYMSEKCILV